MARSRVSLFAKCSICGAEFSYSTTIPIAEAERKLRLRVFMHKDKEHGGLE